MKTTETKLQSQGVGVAIVTDWGRRICTMNLNLSIEDRIHYSQLFEAAPELLEALKGALEEMEFHDSGGVKIFADRITAARAAINKAEGKE